MSSNFAGVLFLDVVGFSKLDQADQRRALEWISALPEAISVVRQSSVEGEVVVRDYGDACALVFPGSAIQALRAAREVANLAKSAQPRISLRMGLHWGLLERGLRDATGAEQVAGDGINLAQRVMDLGDNGHILLSEDAYSALLVDLPDLPSNTVTLGAIQVKHGIEISVYSYFDGKAGRADAPVKSAGARPMDVRAVPAAPTVALIYKRHAAKDERLMSILRERLRAEGFDVFIDQDLPVGTRWAVAIRTKIREADSAVILLSERAIGSEMIEAEIIEAHQAFQESGKPRILPVRIGFDDPLPPPFSSLLDTLQFVVWHSELDDERVTQEIVRGIKVPATPVAEVRLEPVGGAMSLDSRFYLSRPADAFFVDALERRDGLVLVKGPRQVGKTSLLARGLAEARENGARVVSTDLQSLSEREMENANSFYKGLAGLIARRLGLRIKVTENWDDESPNMSFEYFLEDHAVPLSGELVWGLDEVDRLFGREYGSEVFGFIRSIYNGRASNPKSALSRITLAIGYATEAHLFISDLNQSPFNVGTRLSLDDFDGEQVAELNARYGSPLRNPSDLMKVVKLLGGHPFLTQRALREMVESSATSDDLIAQADLEDGVFGDHLRRLLMVLTKDQATVQAVQTVLRGMPLSDTDVFSRLRSGGILKGESPRDARFRCELYRRFLDRHLR